VAVDVQDEIDQKAKQFHGRGLSLPSVAGAGPISTMRR
jgi:hypothetical protein